jgi:hypothetical protein
MAAPLLAEALTAKLEIYQKSTLATSWPLFGSWNRFSDYPLQMPTRLRKKAPGRSSKCWIFADLHAPFLLTRCNQMLPHLEPPPDYGRRTLAMKKTALVQPLSPSKESKRQRPRVQRRKPPNGKVSGAELAKAEHTPACRQTSRGCVGVTISCPNFAPGADVRIPYARTVAADALFLPSTRNRV